MSSSLLFVLLSLLSAVEPPSPASPEVENEVDSVTVTAKRPAPVLVRPGRASFDPFDVFSEHCFESNRLHRRSAIPAEDPAWRRLEASAREALRLDPSAVAFSRTGHGKPDLVLLVDEQVRPGRLVEHRCTVMILGAHDQSHLARRMSDIFDGAGTENHVDFQPAPAYRALPGWRQWLWSAIPARDSTEWSVHGKQRNRNRSFVVVTSPSFYNRNRYVAGDLKVRQDATRPISMLTLSHTSRS